MPVTNPAYLGYLEGHIHTRERWFGISADQSVNDWALEATLNPFVVVSQAGDFTAVAIKVLGTDDTPNLANKILFDFHRILIASATDNLAYIFRVIWGTGTSAAAEGAGQYSDVVFAAPVAAGPGAGGAVLDIRMPQLAVGTKVWVKLSAATAETVTFYIGLHEYPV